MILNQHFLIKLFLCISAKNICSAQKAALLYSGNQVQLSVVVARRIQKLRQSFLKLPLHKSLLHT